jgi:putative ABC transport system permease protein
MSRLPTFRVALRQLRRAPGYTATAILTLALALGANSAIFSAVRGVLLRPLPIEAPGELMVVWQTDTGGQAVLELTHRHWREWTTAGAPFTHSALVASHNWDAVLEGRGEPTRIWFAGVSASFFDTLGVAPAIGRAFRPEDDVPNAAPVAVLSHATWVSRFGGDTSVVGQNMTLDGEPMQIVGVMPAGVEYPTGAEFWTPVVPILTQGDPPNMAALDGLGVLYVLGRVRAGVDAARLRSDIDQIERRLDATIAGRLEWGERAVVTPLLDHIYGPVRPALWLLWAAVTVLLVIACANLSGLLVTRVSLRRRENAVRLALGATRSRLGRLWLAEIGIVSAAGGTLGLAFAVILRRAIVALAPPDLPGLDLVAIDGWVAAFTASAVIVTTLLVSIVPMRQAGDVGLAEVLSESGRATASRRTLRTRSVLLVAQIGLAVVMLVAAGLVLRSFVALRQIDLGFQSAQVVTAVVQPRSIQMPVNEWLSLLLERVRSSPGVEAAGAVYLRPLALGRIGMGVLVGLEGQPETPAQMGQNPTLNWQAATPGYFEAMRIRLVRGRLFTASDRANGPRVAIVSESTARRLWPGQDPIGRRMLMSRFTPGQPGRDWRTVVGVVRDVRYRGLDEVQLDVYDPAPQVGFAANQLVVRSSLPAAAVMQLVQTHARQLDPTAIVDGVISMDAVVARATAPWQLSMWLFLLFAGIAFGLAVIGLFSLVALDVAQRQREFAIRLALGATRGDIVGAVLRQAGLRVAIGVAIGLTLAVTGTRVMRSLLFEVAPTDTLTYGAVLTLVLAVVSLAAYIPARRASRTDPQRLLRA